MVLRVVLIPDRRVMKFDEPGLILGEIVQRLGLDQEDITVVINGMIIETLDIKCLMDQKSLLFV